MTTDREEDSRRKNIRLALVLGAFALLVFITSFPFWTNLFKMIGNQAR
ncbi:MAG: hypothetical protein KDI63_03060 [Gammaproteobacteria bacterium]|nr:hypothetical protein [Gammaproteobacteria bacterium]